jgi:hypothetical protein
MTELLTTKELASALGRSRSYICAMKARGFPMPGGTATIEEARAWLSANPPPRGRRGTKRNVAGH